MTRRFNVTKDVIDHYVEKLRLMFEAAHTCKYSHNNWSYYQSLYFVGSVTTTIGKEWEKQMIQKIIKNFTHQSKPNRRTHW